MPLSDSPVRVVVCVFDGCDGEVFAKELCSAHYTQRKKGLELQPRTSRAGVRVKPVRECSFQGCSNQAVSLSLCRGHYSQHYKGKELRPLRNALSPKRLKSGAAHVVYDDGTKYCSRCVERLPISKFHRNSKTKSGLDVACKGCRTRYWVPAKAADAAMRRKYKMSLSEYEEILESQGGACAICGTAGDSGKRLAVDHDHTCCPGYEETCGKCVRGLLCFRCNSTLGRMDDDPSLLEAAARYIRSYGKEVA